jgi:hypothetical protein
MSGWSIFTTAQQDDVAYGSADATKIVLVELSEGVGTSWI